MQRLFKTIGVVGILALTLTAVAESSAQAQAGQRVIEGIISQYECGDNCYLTIVDNAQREHVGLCAAPLCRPWNKDAEMPTQFIGRRVKATIRQGTQLSGSGKVVGKFDAFNRIELLDTGFKETKHISGQPPTDGPIAYIRDGNIFLKVGKQERQLTFAGRDSDAVVSPDGKFIVFTRSNRKPSGPPPDDCVSGPQADELRRRNCPTNFVRSIKSNSPRQVNVFSSITRVGYIICSARVRLQTR